MGDWRFKEGFRPRGKVPAAVVGEVLEQLRAADNLTASAYVEASRPADAPTHETLPWDDAEAAHEHRLMLARTIIRATEDVVVVNPGSADAVTTVVEYIHVPPRAARGEGRYVVSSDIVDCEEDYAAALAEAERRLDSARSAFYRLRRLATDREDTAAIISIASEGFSAVNRALTMLG